MPKYAIERQYLVPVYQHVLIDAPDLDAACRQALDHDDWDSSETDYDNSRETTIAQAVEIPPDFDLEQRSPSECVYTAGLEQLAIPARFATGDDPIYHASPAVRALIEELREIDARGDDGQADVLADRRRAILQELDDKGASHLVEGSRPRPVLDDRELAAVLAGLRLYQRFRNSLHDSNSFLADAWDRAGGHAELAEVVAIATAGGAVDPLVEHEVDALCNRLNGGGDLIVADVFEELARHTAGLPSKHGRY